MGFMVYKGSGDGLVELVVPSIADLYSHLNAGWRSKQEDPAIEAARLKKEAKVKAKENKAAKVKADAESAKLTGEIPSEKE